MFDAFIESYALKYEKAADCLSNDRDTLLASTTSRPSTGNTCGRPTPSKAPSPPCATAPSAGRAAYPTRPRSRWSSKLVEDAQKNWRRLDDHNQLPKLILGVTFADGIEVITKPTDRQPTTAAA
ncbi:hypothetical protein ABIB85_008352 [Bradyrhizobium sp. JR1.5]